MGNTGTPDSDKIRQSQANELLRQVIEKNGIRIRLNYRPNAEQQLQHRINLN